MFRVPGYVVGEALGRAEPPRAFRGTAEIDGRPVVLRRSATSGIVARDALRSAVARVAGVRCADLIVPSTVVTTPDGLVIVYDATVVAVWDGVADFAEPAGAVLAVVRAVDALHESGLAHGALVPEAVWLEADGTVRLACLPGPEEADMAADRKNLQRFAARIAAGHPQVEAAVASAGEAPAPRDLLSRLAPFAPAVRAPVPAPAPPAPASTPPAPQPPAADTPLMAPPVPPAPPAAVPPAPPAAVPQAPDVLRAPRPNRPITRPATSTAQRRMRPVTVAVVGIAVLLSAAGVGIAAAQLTRDQPAPVPAATVTATPTVVPATPVPATPTPSPSVSTPTGDAAWIAVMTTLDATRDGAFVAADPTALDRVYVDGSDAAVADREAMAQLRDSGVHADALRLVLHEVRVLKKSAAHATLRVVDEMPSYRLLDANGAVVRTQPARGITAWRIVLDKSGAGWRIAAIDKLAH